MDLDVFDRRESIVRTYCRDFPTVFERACGHELRDEAGKRYIDFLSGAGALNYGHNNDAMRSRIIEYMNSDGIVHSLDLYTTAKRQFLEAFERYILVPRALDYKVQFCGPTGTNAVEAALKIARKTTGRQNVIAFTNAFHGMSLGALAATGSRAKRGGSGISLSQVTRMPFDGYLGREIDTSVLLRKALEDPGSGVDLPAAIILETIQAEGGINAASTRWLRAIVEIARAYGALVIVDEIQTGCGRTGPFFSFEDAGIVPDVVCLSKSISGYGLPMSLLLMRPHVDTWKPGEHNGTFRGNNIAFVAATVGLEYWIDGKFESEVRSKGLHVSERLTAIARKHNGATVRGRGLLQGIAWEDKTVASEVSHLAFERGVIVEVCGAHGEVLKLLPPLTIPLRALDEGISTIEECLAEVVTGEKRKSIGDGW
jgi:diaminobutyrate-2-oxoglutarate transaminase